MASVGHWDSLAEAEKLVQSVLVSGIIEENIKAGGLIGSGLLPIAQFSGKSAKWNRESTIPTAANFDIGAALAWQSASKTSLQETNLKRIYVQTLLDGFVEEVYTNENYYQAIQLMQDKKAMLQKIENDLIYGDLTFSPDNLEFDGLHALCEASGTNFNGDSVDIEQSGALSLANMRLLEDRMLHGVDAWLFPKVIARRMDSMLQEDGITTAVFGSLGFTIDQIGNRITMWNGTPIIRSDYLVAETNDTGEGSDRRAKNTSGTNWSIFALKFGQVMQAQPGLTYAFGNTKSQGELWKTVFFPDLEDMDASGLRMVHYGALLDGSTVACGRITDVTDAKIVI